MEIDSNTKENIVAYKNLYHEILRYVGESAPAIGILHEVAKDNRMALMHERRERSAEGPATEKQLNFLKKLGVEVDSDVTKKQASRLIDEARAKEE